MTQGVAYLARNLKLESSPLHWRVEPTLAGKGVL
jgi:hypothetical protein